MTDEQTMREVVLEYFICLDTENWGRMRELWHEDGSMRAVGARPREDREAVLGYFRKLFNPWPEHEDKPVRLVISEPDRTVLAEVEFTGRTPDGRTVLFEAVDVFDFSGDGRIVKLSNWYDIDYARRSLAPPAEAAV
jgi:ketosteroid isomerase-like protein